MTAGVVARGAGLLVMLWLTWRVASRGVTFTPAGLIVAILDGANFVFHEAGHVLFLFFGQFLQALGGSLTQVAIPAACTVYFWQARRRGAAAAALFWTGESITHVAIYVADGRARVLPLHGGPGVIHDWHFLLSQLGLLEWAEGLGRLTFAGGFILILGALLLLALDLHRPPVARTAELGG